MPALHFKMTHDPPANAGDLINWLQKALLPAIDTSEALRAEVRWMMEAVLDKPWTQIVSFPEATVSQANIQRVIGYLEQRVNRHRPLHYVLGSTCFCGLNLTLSQAVLIPRPETEQLVDLVLEHVKVNAANQSCIQIADIATGSGAIALALKAALSERARLTASDLSAPALAVASENASALGLEVSFRLGDGLWALPPQQTFDVIVSNPPYIPHAEYQALMPEVKIHEPKSALLTQDPEGLSFYRHFATQAAEALTPGGLIALELSQSTSQIVYDLFKQRDCWKVRPVINDYFGVPRFLMASRH
ncbi:MAG: peptide chain release factor N(5)-glutamine methyltransferase [Vampirovibrionales bacterium]|nr:peptide chain release factor N(5)-glutamine methyltransferase [Vampirovibrionales bacterium]